MPCQAEPWVYLLQGGKHAASQAGQGSTQHIGDSAMLMELKHRAMTPWSTVSTTI